MISVDDLTTGRIANLVEARGYGKDFTFFNMDVRGRRPVAPVRAAPARGRLPPGGAVRRAPVARGSRARRERQHHGRAERPGVRREGARPARSSTRRAAARSTASRGACPRRSPPRRARIPLSPYGISKKVVARLPRLLPALPRARLHGARARRTSTARGRIRTARPASSRSSRAGCSRTSPSTIYGDGNQTRDFVFIDDVVHAFVQAIDRGSGKLVNIGTGLESSVNGRLPDARRDHRVRQGARARPAAARASCAGSSLDIATAPVRARVEAVDAPRGRPRRDGRVPQGHLTSAGPLPFHRRV